MSLSSFAHNALVAALGGPAGIEVETAVNTGSPATGSLTLTDGNNIIVGTSTGTEIGTAATQLIGFFGTTPIVQPANTVDYVTMLVNLGLRASGGTAAATFPGRVTAAIQNTKAFTTDVYGSTIALDVTKGLHVIAASHTTAAACTITPSAAGTAGDELTIITETDGSGTCTLTFASTFIPATTQVCTLSSFSSITFTSDGTQWIEKCRVTAA